MKQEEKLLEMIANSTDPEEALRVALEVIHAALKRLESEPEYQPLDHPEEV